MNAADTTGSEDLDTRQRRDDHGRRNGRRAIFLTRQQNGQVTTRSLDDRLTFFAQVLDLFGRTTGFEFSANDGDSSRYSSVLTDRLLHFERRLHVLRVRHAVTDNGRFECHHRLAGIQCLLHFMRY